MILWLLLPSLAIIQTYSLEPREGHEGWALAYKKWETKKSSIPGIPTRLCVVLNMLQKCETRDRASKINSVFKKKKRERKMRKGILRIRGNILYPRGNMEYNTIQKN